MRESARFTPGLRVLMLRERQPSPYPAPRGVPPRPYRDQLRATAAATSSAWKETALDAVILDEAQNIKNPDTAIARAVRELVAPHRLALTGTPLENRARSTSGAS